MKISAGVSFAKSNCDGLDYSKYKHSTVSHPAISANDEDVCKMQDVSIMWQCESEKRGLSCNVKDSNIRNKTEENSKVVNTEKEKQAELEREQRLKVEQEKIKKKAAEVARKKRLKKERQKKKKLVLEKARKKGTYWKEFKEIFCNEGSVNC